MPLFSGVAFKRFLFLRKFQPDLYFSKTPKSVIKEVFRYVGDFQTKEICKQIEK